MVESDRERAPFGRFNVFRALRLARYEIRHSNFLGWLLDPAESHGQRDLFLSAFVGLAEAGGIGNPPATDWSSSLDGAQVDREHDAIDLRIVVPARRLVIAVENKLFTDEHSEQLMRYEESVRRSFPDWRHTLLYLTLDGNQPSDERWRPLSHHEIMTMIVECQGRMRSETPPEIRAFIQDYVDVLTEIYAQRTSLSKNARVPEVRKAIVDSVLERNGWILVADSPTVIECGPRLLFEALPPIGTKRGRDVRQWLTLRFQDHGAQGYVGRYWRPSDVSDHELRNLILRSLLEDRRTGFKYKAGSIDHALSRQSPAFSGDRIQDFRTGRVAGESDLRALVGRELGAIDARLGEIVRVVRGAVAKHPPQG